MNNRWEHIENIFWEEVEDCNQDVDYYTIKVQFDDDPTPVVVNEAYSEYEADACIREIELMNEEEFNRNFC